MDVSGFPNHRVGGKDGFKTSHHEVKKDRRRLVCLKEAFLLGLGLVSDGFWRDLKARRGQGAGGCVNSCSGGACETRHACWSRADWLHLLWSCCDAEPLTPDEAMNEFMERTVRDGMNGGTKNQMKNQRFGCNSRKACPDYEFEFICCFKNTTRRQTSVKNPAEAAWVTLILMLNLTDRTLFFLPFHDVPQWQQSSVTQIFTWRLVMCSLCRRFSGTYLVSMCLVNFSLH